MAYVRSASHAAPAGQGWYDASPAGLKKQIDNWFATVESNKPTFAHSGRLLGLIAPHAGLSYSGKTASAVYAVLRDYIYGSGEGSKVERVFVLGPSHTKGYDGVEFSAASVYEGPLGHTRVDAKVIASLRDALRAVKIRNAFTSQHTDEAEHSIEMQMPFLTHVLNCPPAGKEAAAKRVTIVPMIVGWTEMEDEAKIAAVLKPYLEDTRNFFVFSSDFCHWGSRFRYTYHFQKEKYPQIGDAIIAMDHAAMNLIEKNNLDGWYRYLDETQNTICGRHPIGIGMQYWVGQGATAKFLGYSQSNKCAGPSDSSVSYAAAVISL